MGMALIGYPYDIVGLQGCLLSQKVVAHARGGDILDIRSSGVSSQAPPRPCSPSTVCTAFDIVRPFSRGFMAVDEVNVAD